MTLSAGWRIKGYETLSLLIKGSTRNNGLFLVVMWLPEVDIARAGRCEKFTICIE